VPTYLIQIRQRHIFFWNPYWYFQNFFTDNQLATDTNIPKFAKRYFNKAFWLKLVQIAYSPDLRQLKKQKMQNKKIISKKYWQDMKNFE